jgi:copper chaperone CopZ
MFTHTPYPYLETPMTTATETAESREYVVLGMSCDHCTISVHEEVAEVPGVSAVDVDLESGRLAVRGGGIDDDAVRAAVAEAGYELE